MRKRLWFLGLILVGIMPVQSYSQESGSSRATVSVTKLSEHVYKLECREHFSVNAVASVGPDGILMVDAGQPSTAEKLRQTLDSLGGGQVKYVVNTHVHDDHTGGNSAFDHPVSLIAHEFTAHRLVGNYFSLPPLREVRRVDIAVSGDFSIFFNGEEIRFIHTPDAHTAGDLMVFFPESKVLCLADLVFPDMIPFVDLDLGGNVQNYVDNLRRLADTLSPEITIVPGHGRNFRVDDVKDYLRMLDYTCSRVREAMKTGETADEVLQDTALSRWAAWSNTFETTRMEFWIPCVFRSFRSENQPLTPSICEPLTATIVESGVEAAIAQYQTLKEGHATEYNFHENEVNNLGYQLMWRQMLPEAIAIFQLNIKEHPESANVYDSMGEAYMNNGQNELAIQAYEKSLELNPENTNAVQMLERIRSGQ